MQGVADTHQDINKKYFINYFLPVAMIGWMGSSVKYLNYLFSENTRWLFLGIMLLYLCTKPKIIRFMDSKLTVILLLYCVWCLSTSLWSTIPELSIMKSGIYVLLIPILMSVGLEWVRKNPGDKTLNYLGLFAIATIVSASLGKKSIDPHEYYSGIMTGSNMLGFMVAGSTPYLFWKTYQTHGSKWFYLFLLLSLAALYYVLLSMSRSSILMVLGILFSIMISFNLNKKVLVLLLTVFFGVGLVTFNPSMVDNSIAQAEKYVFKGQQNIFHSRAKSWNQSYQGAVEGGWTGLGFGVAYGDYNFNLENRLTSVGYGREKGNSQLAIIEEIGLTGLILYAGMMIYMLIKLIAMRFQAPSQDMRVLSGIVAGTFVGMFILSLFEAWWLSPGSPESMYFWVLMGIIRGLEITIQHQRKGYA